MLIKDYNKYLESVEKAQKDYDQTYEYYKWKYGSKEEYVFFNGERPQPFDEVDFLIEHDDASCYSHYNPCCAIPFSEEIVVNALKRLYIEEYNKRNRRDELKFSDDKEKIFYDVAKWLTNPERRDCLMLCGGLGNGKTTMIKAINRFLDLLFTPECSDNSVCFYKNANDINCNENGQYGCAAFILIDDIGAEPKSTSEYGAIKTPVRDLLLKAYEERWTVIVTTNLDFDGIVNHYERRTADRCKEMFERIVFNEDSFRK